MMAGAELETVNPPGQPAVPGKPGIPGKPGKPSKRAVIWYAVHLLLLAVFGGYLTYQESFTIKVLAAGEDMVFESMIHNFLSELQWSFLPALFWRSFWPFLLIGLALLVFTRWRFYFLALMGAFSATLLLADRIYFLFFSSVIPISSLGAAHQIWDVKASLWAALTLADLWWLGSFGLFALAGWRLNRVLNVGLNGNRTLFIIDKAVGIAALLLAAYAWHLADYIPTRYLVQDNNSDFQIYETKPVDLGVTFAVPYQNSYRSFATAFGVFNFHRHDLADSLANRFADKELDPAALNQVIAMLDHKKALNDRPSPLHGIAAGRNVFLISMESFGSFVVGMDVDGQVLTPCMNAYSQNHLYWPHTLDNVKTGGTSDAEFSILTGLLPDVRQMAAMGIIEDNDLLSLPASLAALGYGTHSFHGNIASFWNRNINHPLLGIAQMHFIDSFKTTERYGLGLADKPFFEESLDILADADHAFFAFLISLTSHHPYLQVPPGYAEMMNLDMAPSELKRYFELVRYSDDALAILFERARELGLWENSIFVIYGDHRPPFDKESADLLQARTGISFASPRGSQIPLLLVMPGLESQIAPYREELQATVGSLQDVYPTVLHLLGAEIPYGVYGTHLFIPGPERDAIPVLKKGNSFIFNGICYSGQPTRGYRDDLGLVFLDQPEREIDPVQRHQRLKEAIQALELHFYLFDNNAQSQARKARQER